MSGSALRAISLAVALSSLGSVSANADVEISGPVVGFAGAPLPVTLTRPSAAPDDTFHVRVSTREEARDVRLLGASPVRIDLRLESGETPVVTAPEPVSVYAPSVYPGWWALLPPIVAIAVALVTRQVVLSLVAGVFLGALMLHRFDPWGAFHATLATYVVGSLAGDPDHVTIVFIASILGGMSGVISRSGGAKAIVERIASRARDARSAQLSTWFMGLVVFFDDYANTLIVGNMMRPLTDRLRVSREKLAFLVDSTSAPIASIAPISTWIGFEVGLLDDALTGIGRDQDAYGLFLSSIPYRFYPIFALLLGLFLVLARRDFGSMHRAELRAREGRGLWDPNAEPLMDTTLSEREAASAGPAYASNALVPILVVILATLGGIWLTGWTALAPGERTLRAVVASGDSYRALLWAGALGSTTAVLLAALRRSLSLGAAMGAWVDGIRAMTTAVIILVLAWGIGGVCRDVGTANVLVGYLGERVPAALLPSGVFILSALVSFSTGTSWGTMAILVPIVVPLGVAVGGGSDVVLVGAVSGVLAGSVFGDHCSPISDTTVLSSLASGSDHIDHVRTQLPYALVAAAVATCMGDVATGLGLPVWGALLLGTVTLVLVVAWRGRPLPS